eukprot:TRINITY_DN5578_c0_g6_i1.p1 TRINITY_DN5578_c0_g6~~TRINITY_DN5578_c0_g6_i1.p1  ORF type:complete len:441 (+),score=107.37 TRINITY_DN5578_c0_g6_i1:290-1612(+)
MRKLCEELSQANTLGPLCSFTAFINHFVPSVKEFQEQFPLHLAVTQGHLSIIDDLMNIVDINLPNKYNKTALALAFRKANKKAVSILLTHDKLQVSRTISNEGTALHIALKLLWFDVADAIIEHPMFSPNIKDSFGNTPLHILFANYSGNSAKVKALCRKLLAMPNCNPNIRNNNNMTPLHSAADNNQVRCIRFCLRHCQTRHTKNRLDFNALGGPENFSILHYLAVHSRVEVIMEVVSAGVSVLTRNANGQTAKQLMRSSVGRKIMFRHEREQRLKLINQYEDSSISRKTTIKAPFASVSTASVVRTEYTDNRKLNTEEKKLVINNPLLKIEEKMIMNTLSARDHKKIKETERKTKSVSELVGPRCFWLQHMMTAKHHSKLLRYKALYSIFYQCNEEAVNTLKTLLIKMNKNELLRDNVSHLHWLLKNIIGCTGADDSF